MFTPAASQCLHGLIFSFGNERVKMDLANAIATPDFGGNEFAAAYHFAHRFGVAFEIGSGLGDVVGFKAHGVSLSALSRNGLKNRQWCVFG